MSEVVAKAVEALNGKIGNGFAGRARIVIEGEGSILLDHTGARAGEGESDVTLTASADTFIGILTGQVNPTVAYMTGKLSVDGALGLAIQLGAALS